MEPHKLQFEAR